MIYVYRVMFFIVVLLLQFSIFPWFWNGLFEPDLLLATVILLGLLRNGETACLAGLFLGLLSDVNAGIILGSNALVWTQVGMVSTVIRNHLVVDSPMVQTVVTGLSCILAGCFGIVFYRISASNEPLGGLLLIVFTRSIVTAIVAWPLSRIMLHLGLISEQRHA
ncbi:rod shape-determining protein MreD [bacterium]|nr:rod shape-determining protein MreD [bacterium]